MVALKLLGPPLALLVLVSALVSSSAGKLGRLGLRSVGWYLVTALAAAIIGVSVAYLLGVGAGLSFGDASGLLKEDPDAVKLARRGWAAGLDALFHGPMLLIGFCLLYLAMLAHGWRRSESPSGIPLWRRLLDRSTQIAFRMLDGLMMYAPIGVFAVTAMTVGTLRLAAAAPLLTILIAVYLAQLVVCVGCMVIVRAGSHAAGAFLLGVREALLTALVSGSSAVALPLEFLALERRLGIPRALVGLVLPLGLAMHKLGTAVHQAVILVFAATAMGQDLSLAWLGGLSLLTVLASAITPPVSGGSAIALTFVFGWVGLPLEAIAISLAIPLLGKLNTPINSLGRLVSAVVLVGRVHTVSRLPEEVTAR